VATVLDPLINPQRLDRHRSAGAHVTEPTSAMGEQALFDQERVGRS